MFKNFFKIQFRKCYTSVIVLCIKGLLQPSIYLGLSNTSYIIMALVVKPASFNSYNVGINDLHDNLDNRIKNKQYTLTTSIHKNTMGILKCSTCAGSSDLTSLDGVGSFRCRYL